LECVQQSDITMTWGWKQDWWTAHNQLWSIHPCQCRTGETMPSTSA